MQRRERRYLDSFDYLVNKYRGIGAALNVCTFPNS